jgi:hypothetical protein
MMNASQALIIEGGGVIETVELAGLLVTGFLLIVCARRLICTTWRTSMMLIANSAATKLIILRTIPLLALSRTQL